MRLTRRRVVTAALVTLAVVVVSVPAYSVADVMGLVPLPVQRLVTGRPGQSLVCWSASDLHETARATLAQTDGLTTPVVVGDRALVSDAEAVHAFPTDGAPELWSAPVGRYAPVLVAGDVAVVTSSAGSTGVDLATGRERWTSTRLRNPGTGFSDAAVAAMVPGAVVTGEDGDRGVVTLDAASGAVLWAATDPDALLVAGVDGQRVYTSTFHDRGLQARDARSGRVVWSAHPGPDTQVITSPGLVHAVTDAFVGSSGTVVTYRADTGRELWRRTLTGDGSARPAASAGVLALPDGHDGVVVLDPATGRQLWHDDLDGGGAIATTPGTVVLADGHGVRVRSLGGDTHRTAVRAPARVDLPMVAAGGGSVCAAASWNQISHD